LILLAYYSVYIQVPQVKETMGRKWKERVRDYSIPSSLLFRNNFPKNKVCSSRSVCRSTFYTHLPYCISIYIYVCYCTFFPSKMCKMYPGVTSFRRCKEQYYISVRHMHALSKEIEHMYK